MRLSLFYRLVIFLILYLFPVLFPKLSMFFFLQNSFSISCRNPSCGKNTRGSHFVITSTVILISDAAQVWQGYYAVSLKQCIQPWTYNFNFCISFFTGPNCQIIAHAKPPKAKRVQCKQCTTSFCFHVSFACPIDKEGCICDFTCSKLVILNESIMQCFSVATTTTPPLIVIR